MQIVSRLTLFMKLFFSGKSHLNCIIRFCSLLAKMCMCVCVLVGEGLDVCGLGL